MAATYVIFTVFMIGQAVIVTAAVCGPTFQRLFGLSSTQLGICLGAMSLGSMTTSFFSGHIIQRISALKILLLGHALCVAGVCALLFSDGFRSLIATLIVLGMIAALVKNANTCLLSDFHAHNMRRMAAIASGLWFFSTLFFAILVGAWVHKANDYMLGKWTYRIPYLFNIILLLVVMFLIVRLVSPAERLLKKQSKLDSETKAPPKNGLSRFGTVSIVCILLLGILHNIMVVPLTTWTSPMTQIKFGVGDFGGALVLGMICAGLGGGRLLLWSWTETMNDRILIMVSNFFGGLLFVLSLYAHSYTSTLVFLTLGGIMTSFTAPCLLTLVAKEFEQTKAVMYGYLRGGLYLGGMLGPFLIGIMVDLNYSIDRAFLLVPAASWMICLITMFWESINRPDHSKSIVRSIITLYRKNTIQESRNKNMLKNKNYGNQDCF